MATAYGVICDVLKFSDIYPTIIYIDFVVNMHGKCIISDETKGCFEVKNHPKQVGCERVNTFCRPLAPLRYHLTPLKIALLTAFYRRFVNAQSIVCAI